MIDKINIPKAANNQTSLKYSEQAQRPQIDLIIERNGKDGAPNYSDAGWQAVKTFVNKEDVEFTLVRKPTIEGGDEYLEKWVPTDALYAYHFAEVKGAQEANASEIGAGVVSALESLGAEQQDQAEQISPEPKVTFESVTAEMDQLKKTIPAKDQVAVWRYATAFHDYEIHNAFAQLQPEARAVAMQMRDLYDKRSKTRSQ